MKKLWLLLSVVFFPALSHAALTDPQVNQEKTVCVHYSTTVPVNSSPAVVDLIHLASATANSIYIYPHYDLGEIDVTHIRVDVDKLTTSTGSVKIGVLDFVNQSTGSVKFFWGRSYAKNVSNTDTSVGYNETPSFFRCKVLPKAGTTEGDTPFIASNDTRNGSALYNLATKVKSPTDDIFPGRGDIMMEITNSDATNTVIVNVDILYHSEP